MYEIWIHPTCLKHQILPPYNSYMNTSNTTINLSVLKITTKQIEKHISNK